MPRKFKLNVKRKYAWKKKQTCQLIVEHVPVSPITMNTVSNEINPSQSLIVSMPLEVLLSAEVSTFFTLQQRVQATSVLPTGMTCSFL